MYRKKKQECYFDFMKNFLNKLGTKFKFFEIKSIIELITTRKRNMLFINKNNKKINKY